MTFAASTEVPAGRERSSSQFGEDRIVARLLDLAGVSGRVGEFGAGDGEHLSNSALFRRRGWEAVLAEVDPEHGGAMIRAAQAESGTLAYTGMTHGPVTVDNVADWFGGCDAFVSIDVDGDDYLLLEALLAAGARPAVLCVEFNQSIPWRLDVHPTVPGSPANRLGASAWALARLGLSAGYRVESATECNLILASPDVRPISLADPEEHSRLTLFEDLGPAYEPWIPSPAMYLVTNYDGVPYRIGPEPPWGLTLPIDPLSVLAESGYVVEESG